MATNTIRMSAETRGLEEIDKILKKLPAEVAGQHLIDALNFGAEVIVDEAKRLVPYDTSPNRPPQKPHLRDAIKTGNEIKGKRRGASLDVGIDYTIAGGGVSWGHFVEFGTKHRFKKGTGRSGAAGAYTGSTAPQPFMRPAFDGKVREAVHRVGDFLWDRLTSSLRKRLKGV